jgi:peptidoglycan hydrolase-like protein with peptidoglycan-binding domain/phosphodiesterase/alkaline phosphatase D-like protein
MKIRALVSGIAVFAMLFSSAGPVFALGELSPPPIEIPPVIIVPPADTTAPVISSVASLSLATAEATIVWTTDELAVSHFEYGTSTGYGTQPTLDATALLAHTAILTGLTAGTTYYYCIHATDLSQNTANSCGHSFTTAANLMLVDSTPPNITLVTVAPITTTSATIGFTTSEIANAEVEYGVTAGYGTMTPLDTNLALTHAVMLSNLQPNTIYHYRIKTSDEIGNQTVGPDETFTTQALSVSIQTPDTTAPQVQTSSVAISTIETTSITTSGATITWQTDLPSDSQVEYGDSENLGTLSALNTVMTTSHSVTLTGLSQNTNYIFKVKSKPVGVLVQTVSISQEFDTLSQAVPVVAPANILSVSSSAITTAGVTISWTTDKNSTSKVEYGINTSYGASSAINQTMQTSHSVSLSNLQAGTTYHYRVQSIDEASNITYSEDYTFTTSPSTTSFVSAPGAITDLAVGGYDNSSVALAWNAQSANADIAATYDIRYYTIPISDSNFSSAIPAQSTSIVYTDLDPNGTQRTFIVAGLELNTMYYFAVKSHFQASDYSQLSNVASIKTTKGASISNETNVSGVSGNSAGSSGFADINLEYGKASGGGSAGSFEPTLVKAEPADGQIIFSWHNPGEANFVRTVVVRKDGSYPASPTDGQTIYEGRAETFTDTTVHNDKTYYYAVYSYNHSKTYSNGIKISLAPSSANKEVKFNESGVENLVISIDHFTKVFKRGDKDIEIEHLQEILSADGDSYAQKYITGYFGALTETALKIFQAKHGIPKTGIVDAATQKELNAIAKSENRLEVPQDYSVFTTNMKLGDRNDAVAALQTYLIYEGSLSNNNNDGIFRKSTKAAVMVFQKKYRIDPVSGYVGYKTRHKMQQLAGL